MKHSPECIAPDEVGARGSCVCPEPRVRFEDAQDLADLPLNDKGEPYDWSHALAILAKQRAEIERLEKELEAAECRCVDLEAELRMARSTARTAMDVIHTHKLKRREG